HENIRAELAVARPNDLPTAIKGHREWDIDSISYKLDQSPAVTSFIEVEHQKRLSTRNFIEISCSLIASTGASLKLIKMDKSREVIGIQVMVRKLDNPEYCPINPVLPSYKPKINDEIQDRFDSVPITNNTTSDYVGSKSHCPAIEHKVSDSSSNTIDEKALPLETPAHNQSAGLVRDRCHVDTTISEASTVEKKIPEFLTPLSSEFLIKNESDIDSFYSKNSKCRKKNWNNGDLRLPKKCEITIIIGKKSARAWDEADFLEYKRNFEAKRKVPTTPYKKELKSKSLALIEYI
ncbi:9447_t:CDS:2, partial [Paraglomus occultum]